MFRKRILKALAIPAALVLGCILIGCDKGESVDPSSPASYMNDKAFMAKVNEHVAKGNGIRAAHMKLKAEYDALKASDPASPRLKELEAEMKAKQEAFEANRKAQLAFVRERLAPKNPAAPQK